MTAAVAKGEHVGVFEIEALIGRGGMGEVYRARHTTIGRVVALKLLLPQSADQEAFTRRFLREARLMAELDHPAIVPVFDAGESDGRLFLAMALVRGQSLKALLEQGRPAVGETVGTLRALAAGLDYAHRRGVVHRDVTPANVLVDDERVRLADFGISTAAAEQGTGTISTDIRGTARYMSPEQADGDTVTAAADLYSLAVIAFEMLTGEVPFADPNPLTVLLAHSRREPPRASSVEPSLPPAVDGVLSRGLAKKPSERFPSASAFVEALADALGQTAPATTRGDEAARTPFTRSGRAPLSRRARRTWLAAGVLVLVAAVVSGILLWPSPTPATISPDGPVTGGPAASLVPRGVRLYEADFTNPQASFVDLVSRDLTGATVRTDPSQLELSVSDPSGDAGTDLRLDQTVTTYVADLAFAVQPGSNVLFCTGLRWAVAGKLAWELCVNTAAGWIQLSRWDGTNHVPIAPRSYVTEMGSGRTISTSVLVEDQRMTLWVDGVRRAEADDPSVPPTATKPGLDVYGNSGTGGILVRDVRLSTIAR